MSDKYFYLEDQAHHKCIIAGDKYDGVVYHQEHKGRDNAQWRFVDTGDGYYYIYDRRHGKAIIAGDKYDGHLYHQAPKGRANAQWKISEGSNPGSFILTDRKHGKALIAGDKYDGRLYHQAPGDRSNAQWTLTLAQDGEQGPDFYIKEQELLDLELQISLAKRLSIPPLVIDGIIINESGVDQTCEFNKKQTDIITEEWKFENSVMVSVLQSVATKAGGEFSGISASVETKTEIHIETRLTWNKNVSKTTENTIEWNIPVKVPAHSRIHLVSEIKKNKADIPFVATIRNTLGNGETKVVKEHGVWKGAEYLAATINYKNE
jgi:hypothetical protein